jgi:hypothetical protein
VVLSPWTRLVPVQARRAPVVPWWRATSRGGVPGDGDATRIGGRAASGHGAPPTHPCDAGAAYHHDRPAGIVLAGTPALGRQPHGRRRAYPRRQDADGGRAARGDPAACGHRLGLGRRRRCGHQGRSGQGHGRLAGPHGVGVAVPAPLHRARPGRERGRERARALPVLADLRLDRRPALLRAHPVRRGVRPSRRGRQGHRHRWPS